MGSGQIETKIGICAIKVKTVGTKNEIFVQCVNDFNSNRCIAFLLRKNDEVKCQV